MQALGLKVEEVGERLQFRLPCPRHGESGCSIYGERFTKCRTFRCALLRRLDAGETSLERAMQSVETAKQMLRRLVERDAGAALMRYRAKWRREEPPKDEDGGEARRLWLEMLAFDVFLDRSFRNKATVEAIEERR
jgi:hypothetical protein